MGGELFQVWIWIWPWGPSAPLLPPPPEKALGFSELDLQLLQYFFGNIDPFKSGILIGID